MSELRVALERGKTWTFAIAVDWPGWSRRAKGRAGEADEAAVEALLDYTDRYGRVAGQGFSPGEPTVLWAVEGTPTTDFGATDVRLPSDADPLDPAERDRQVHLLQRCWTVFDEVVATSSEQLLKGPRGGGRDRDGVVDHVREAERSYARACGARVPPRTPWPEQREAIVAALLAAPPQWDDEVSRWPTRYYLRRSAWHVLDHAWEIEDKQV